MPAKEIVQDEKAKILLVDDEISILNALKRLLRKEDVAVTVTSSPGDAVKLLEKEKFAVIVSDHRMPLMTGTQLLKVACKKSPDTVRIMLTGYADAEAAIDAINKGAVTRFLAKPWNDVEMRVAVRQAVSHYKLVQEKRRLEKLADEHYKDLQDIAIELEEKVEKRTEEISVLNEQLKQSFLLSVRVMAELTEMHSKVIGNHSKRIRALSKDIGMRMEMSEEDIFQLEVAAMLHNIGTVGINPDILEKPYDSLSAKDKELLHGHPIRGEAVLKLVPNLTNAARLVRHMHELFNGQGYPEHLKGDQIPLGSRIIAVVDAYDTFLNLKTKYDSMTPSDALESVQDCTPGFYDPEVVAILIKCLAEDQWKKQVQDEIEVQLKELRPGMVISRDLIAEDGKLLLSKDSGVDQEQLFKIKNYLEKHSILTSIFVYRKKQ